jgi:hypothetical protein
LNRTPASASNRKTWTWSGWVKRGVIDANRRFLFNSGTAGTDSGSFAFEFFSDYTIRVASGLTQFLLSAPLYRDPSAWYHIVLSVNTTNLTTSDRIIVYVNGSRIATSSYTEPSTDLDTAINNNAAHFIGCYESGPSLFFDGYLTEINFVDGQALTPSSFGETDAVTGRWKAKAYSGSYGTNGFYLKFADNSSTAALGTDSSGNGNTWDVNNFVVSPVDGAGNDSLVDSPTNYGSDSGVGGEVRGNYATLNPLVSAHTYSNGNLDVALSTAGVTSIPSAVNSLGVSSGKWYFEFTPTVLNTGCLIGITATPTSNVYPGGNSSSYGYYSVDGNKFNNASGTAYGNSFTVNDIIGIAFDIDSGKIWFAKNGTWQASGNPSAGTNAAFTSIASGTYFASMHKDTAGAANALATFNFGQRPFAYAAPSGFKALCTTNLTTPTIKKPSSYMDVVTYTGNGAVRTISGLSFSPDLVWIKNRSIASQHVLTDSVRGTDKQLFSSLTNDEQTSNSGITSFTSSGFTLGTNIDPVGDTNSSSNLFVAWAWDESPQDGFDIVSYTGNGANRTISHNLGVAPKMLIVKARTTAGADQGWPVWHASIANTTYLTLSTTSATATGADYWNSTSPTSSVFSVGTNAAVNENNDTYIAYCFAEIEGFSKFGSYDGNGSADGPFVYCGFRPRYLLVKRTDSAFDWVVFDSARSTFNEAQASLFPNANSAEYSGGLVDFDLISNGFKARDDHPYINASGGTYIFAAFAEQSFKYARAR